MAELFLTHQKPIGSTEKTKVTGIPFGPSTGESRQSSGQKL
jgi:hypothetical protein